MLTQLNLSKMFAAAPPTWTGGVNGEALDRLCLVKGGVPAAIDVVKKLEAA